MLVLHTNEASAFGNLSVYERTTNQLREAASRHLAHIDLGSLKVYELQAERDKFSERALAIMEEAEVHFQYANNLGEYMVQLKSRIAEMEKGIAL